MARATTAVTQREAGSKLAGFSRAVSGTQLAEILGISKARVSQLHAAGLPRDPTTKLYELAAVIPWLIRRTKKNAGADRGVRENYYLACAERAQLEAEKVRGNLYDRAEVDRFLMRLLTQFRELILALPERVTRDRAVAHTLDVGIYRELENLADRIGEWAEKGTDEA